MTDLSGSTIAPGNVTQLPWKWWDSYHPIPYERIEGDFTYDQGLWRDSFTKLKRIGGNMALWNVDDSETKRVYDSDSPGLHLGSLGVLEYVGGDIQLHGAEHLIDTGELKNVGGDLDLYFVANLERLSKLEFVAGNLLLPDRTSAFTKDTNLQIEAPRIRYVGGDMVVGASRSEMAALEEEISREELIDMAEAEDTYFEVSDISEADATKKFNPEVEIVGDIYVNYYGRIIVNDWYQEYPEAQRTGS